jgi:large subunit ribosomal protein L18
MEKSTQRMTITRGRRAMRVRKNVRGDALKPRLCVVKTNKHIQVQLIDDEKGITLASISTCGKEFKKTEFCKKNKTSAKVLGESIAKKAKALGVETIVFDRGPFKYHGILAEVANSARAGGLQF